MNHTLSIKHYRILAEQLARSKNAEIVSLSFFTPEGEPVDPETWEKTHEAKAMPVISPPRI